MSEQPNQEKLRAILAEQLALDPERITPTARLAEDLDADSLDLAEIVMSIEEEWNLEIDEETVSQWRTVQDILNLIEEICE